MTRHHGLAIVCSLWALLAASCSDQVVMVNLTVTASGPGSVVSDPAGINCPGSCTAMFPAGTLVGLKAQPMADALVTSFSGPAACVPGHNECFFNLFTDVTATAHFDPVPSLCGNGKKDGTETDIDCGGTCAPCPVDSACVKASDCQNAPCVMGLCTSCPLDTNLLFNGDAESAAPGAMAPGWQFSNGFSVQSYDSGNVASTDPGPMSRGKSYFSGGLAGISSATTTIDLAACAKLASVQPVKFKTTGYLGGFGAQSDNFTVQFYARGAQEGPLSTLGPVTAAARSNVTGLLPLQSSVTLPPGTCCVDVSMVAIKASGFSNDGYADNLTVMVSLN